MRGNLFFVVIIGICVGVALETVCNLPIRILMPYSILLVFFTGCWILTRNIYCLVIVIFLVSALVGGMRTSFVQTHIPKQFVSLLNTNVSFEGVVTAPPDVREKNIRLTVKVARENVPTKLVAVVPIGSNILIGEDVQVSGILQLPEPFATDGGRTFAYDKFLAKDGVFALIPNAAVKVIAPRSYLYWLWGALIDLNTRIQRAVGGSIPSPYSSLASGLLLGDKQGLSKPLLTMFTTAGLLQIVVLSGYNVAIVAEAILFVRKFLPKSIAFVLAGLGIVTFVAATGAGSSAVRAGVMALFALVARATNRTYDVVRILYVTLFGLVLYNPLLLVYDPGFQFSFIATLGLIVGSPLIESRLYWIKSDAVRELLATTLAAEIAVLPILLYQTGNFSWVAVPANILVGPLVPYAMALSCVAALGDFLMPWFSALIGFPAYVVLWYIIEIAKTAASLPYAAVTIPAFPFWVVMLAYLLLVALVIGAVRSNKI